MEQVKKYYNDLLIVFKNKKDTWIERERLLKEEINQINENLKLKRNEHSEIVAKQYKLELKTAASMSNKKTGKPLIHNVNPKMR